MKDFLPTFTFGFLMAQLFPGAVAVLSMSCAFITKVTQPTYGLTKLFAAAGDLWFASLRNTIVFAFLSAAVGMFLHGVNWIVIAAMENKEKVGIRLFPFHQKPLSYQFIASPLYVFKELYYLLSSKKFQDVRLDENVAKLDPKAMPNFNFLQDFYLYFAQFFVHMSYALLLSTIAFVYTVPTLGFSSLRVGFLSFLYLMMSAFFLIGRVQFMTLFSAEVDLQEHRVPNEMVPLTVALTTPVQLSLGAQRSLGMNVSLKNEGALGIELSTKE